MEKMINPFISGDDGLDLFDNIFLNHLVPFSKKKIKKDEIIFHPNCSHKYSYYVKSGLIKISAIGSEGKEKDVFFHEPGSLFGFQNINLKKKTITKATAVTDSELYQFEYDFFHEFLRNSPEYFSLFLSYIFKWVILLTEETTNQSLYTTSERLAGLLVILEEEFNKGIKEKVPLPFKNEELAAMLGVSRNSISHAIGLLQSNQIIEKKRNGIIVKNLQKLEEFEKD